MMDGYTRIGGYFKVDGKYLYGDAASFYRKYSLYHGEHPDVQEEGIVSFNDDGSVERFTPHWKRKKNGGIKFCEPRSMAG